MLNVNNQCEQYLKMLKVQYPNESEEDLKEVAEEFSLIANSDQEGLKKFYLRKYQKRGLLNKGMDSLLKKLIERVNYELPYKLMACSLIDINQEINDLIVVLNNLKDVSKIYLER